MTPPLTDDELLYGPSVGSGPPPLADEDFLHTKSLAPATARAADNPGFTWSDFGAGSARGAADLGNSLLNAADWPIIQMQNALGVGGQRNLTNLITGQAQTPGGLSSILPFVPTRAERDAALRDYENTTGKTSGGMFGRLVGATAVTAPLLMAGGVGVAARLPQLAEGLQAAREAGLLGRVAANTLVGGAQGGGAAALTSGGYEQPFTQQVGQGVLLGGALSGAAPVVQGLGRGIANQFVSDVNPAVAQLAREAQTQGINVRGSQISNSKFIKLLDTLSTKLPFSKTAASNAEQKQQFTEAAAETMGITAGGFTPETIKNAKKAIGAKFESVASSVPEIDMTPALRKLTALQVQMRGVVDQNELRPLQAQMQNILSKIENGKITGKQYLELTRHDSMLDKAIGSDKPGISSYAMRMKNSLDDALNESAPEGTRALLSEARYQWKNYKTLQPLIEKAGPEGEINPTLLQERVRHVWDNVDTGGGGELWPLAQIGQRFMKDMGSSNTGENVWLLNAMKNMTGVAAGALGANVVGAGPALLTAGGTVAANHLLTRALTSNLYKNALLRPVATTEPTLGITNRLLTQAGIPLSVEAQQVFNPLASSPASLSYANQ